MRKCKSLVLNSSGIEEDIPIAIPFAFSCRSPRFVCTVCLSPRSSASPRGQFSVHLINSNCRSPKVQLQKCIA